MKAEILIDDASGRFKKGEIGTLLKNNFKKYDCKLYLGDIEIEDIFYEGEMITIRRIFYFYNSEIKRRE